MEVGTIDPDIVVPRLIPNILVVDDEESILKIIAAIVKRKGFRCDCASSIGAARRLMEQTSYDIIFLDLDLPDGSGMDILEQQDEPNCRSIVVIITGHRELNTAVQVMRGGAHDFICKPFALELCQDRLDKAVERWRSRARYRYYQTHLEELVDTMTDRLHDASEQIERVYDATVRALGATLDLRDPETEAHCHRVAGYSVFLGQALGMSAVQLRNLKWGAYLHDIGKIGIPEHVLTKTGALTAEEWELIKVHPRLGFQLISNIDFLREATEVVLYHHEKYDGSGYPRGLKGQSIPLTARIFAVIDSLDAMTCDRPYRKALPFSEFLDELKRQSGKHFDPVIVNKVLELPESVWQVEEQTKKVKLGERIVDAVLLNDEMRR
jgi:response regulator RpfG family c-di-GMP phosphodiesterase